MEKSVLILSLTCLLWSCGVKAPPVAPTIDPVPVEKRLNCSPKDPECDVEDPNYRPQGV